MRTAAALVAAGSLLLATPSAAARTPAPAPEAHGTAVAAARAASEGIDFGRCSEEQDLPPAVECGTLRVPLDYARPDGEQILLTVSRSRATGEDFATGRAVPRQGSLVNNPGGPGVSGMYFPMLGVVPGWKRLAAAYDLVGYAPRGVGRSAPLSCVDPKTFHQGPAPAPWHPSARVKRERAARAAAHARGCAERAGDALRHYTSPNNARDLDVLRAALGESRLTFLGSSYGTYIGALYATLFPSHVRRMVFDSAVNPAPERIWYRNNLAQSAAFEDRWADFRAWVARHHDVYGLGDTAREVRDSYDVVRERLAGEPAGGKVGPAQLHTAMLKAAYYDDHWPQRAHALSAYLRGDPGPLVEQAEEHPEAAAEAENTRAVYLAVECNDAPWPTDFAVWDRDNTRLARRAPFETWNNVWTNLPCAYWPAPRLKPLDVRAGKGELPPTLILAAERDAATPYDGALELHRRLAGSALVTERDAGSHGLAGGANACVNAHLTAYLLEGRVPGRRASCAPRPAPEPTT
ncbi:alpha/beta hydrolase [Streptomyces sp. DH20]|uniref:alpha/beta hydrolase n=1 Tax=Streptomyces sp. DH20 TaxID=2857009 RepID=UPI001E62EF3A|nr:alpha/beta hydrolase [Streptomyces sp. DH20]